LSSNRCLIELWLIIINNVRAAQSALTLFVVLFSKLTAWSERGHVFLALVLL